MTNKITEIIDDKMTNKVLIRNETPGQGRKTHQAVFVGKKLHLSVTEAAQDLGIPTSTLHSQVNRPGGRDDDGKTRLATVSELCQIFPEAKLVVIDDPSSVGEGFSLQLSGDGIYVKRPSRPWARPIIVDGRLFFSVSEAAPFIGRSQSHIAAHAGGVINGKSTRYPTRDEILSMFPRASLVDEVVDRQQVLPLPGKVRSGDGWDCGNDSFDGLEPRLSKFIDVKGKDFVGIIDGNGGVSVFPISDDGREMYSEMKFWASREQVPKIISKTIILVRI